MRQTTLEKAFRATKLVESGMAIKKSCAKAGITPATFYKFKQKQAKPKESKADLFFVPADTALKNSNADLIVKLTAENVALRKFIKDFL